ncbi:hypothetical protein [Streptomyces wuyuanensis]|uniref:hypothetical protein n=1 Tax=Streptomyces wuyuanensis TaxID=1196353 RepID=UPI0036B3EE1C
MAQALSRRTGRLVTTQETGLTDSLLRPGLRFRDHIGETSPLHRVLILARADSTPAGRSLLRQSAYSLASVSPSDWRRAPSSTSLGRARHRVTTEDAETLRAMAKIVADRTERCGGKHGRSAFAARLADAVSRILTAGASSTAAFRELLAATTGLTHLLAMMTCEAGHHGLTQVYFHTALQLARDAGNRVAYAITLRAMSAHALQLGHHRQALDLADAAVEISGGQAQGAAAAYLLSQQAVVRALDGQRHAAIAGLAAAEAQLERASGPEGPFTAYPHAGLAYQRAQALLALGLSSDALDALRESALRRAPERRRTSALTEHRLGEVLMSCGHLDAACTHWHRFLDHSVGLRSARIDEALSRLHKTLRPYQRQRHASAVYERTRSLMLAVPDPGTVS